VTTSLAGVTRADDRIYARRWWTLAVLALSLIIIGLDNFILNVALPTLQDAFRADASELQWVVDAYILVFAGLLLLMGALGDRFGRARTLQLGLVIFGAASIGAALTTTAAQLIAARAVMGLGAALIMPSTLSIIMNVFPPEERGRAIAAWAGVSGLGVGLGPIAGGFLIDSFSWQAVFLINVPFVVTALVLGLYLVPDSRDPEHATFDLPGAALSLAAVTILVYGIIDAPSVGWGSGTVLACFAAAAMLAAAFVWRELHAARPMVDLSLFGNPRLSAGVLATGVNFFSLFAVIFGLTQFLQFVLDQTPFEAGALMLPLGIGIPLGAAISVRGVRRVGTTRVVGTALLVGAVILATVELWSPGTHTWLVALAIFCYAIPTANVMAPSVDAILGAVPAARAGVGSAMNSLAMELGGALGVAVIGSVMDTVYTDKMATAVRSLPPQVAGPAGNSVGGAITIATRMGPAGTALAEAARSAFAQSLGIGALAAAGTLVVGALVVVWLMPARPLPVANDPDTRLELEAEAERAV
jgi:EmrB/QacA subfamily drug resistance transporter